MEAATESLRIFSQQRIEGIRERIGIPVEGSGRNAIRSKPGEPPRKDTEELYFSVKATEPTQSGAVVEVVIYTDDPKAEWLEFGAIRVHSILEPRPFWGPSKVEVGEHLDDLKALFSEYLKGRSPASV